MRERFVKLCKMSLHIRVRSKLFVASWYPIWSAAGQGRGAPRLEELSQHGQARASQHWPPEGKRSGERKRPTFHPQRPERSVFNQTNIGTVSRANLGRLLRDGAERVWAFPSGAMPSWAETETETIRSKSSENSSTAAEALAAAATGRRWDATAEAKKKQKQQTNKNKNKQKQKKKNTNNKT